MRFRLVAWAVAGWLVWRLYRRPWPPAPTEWKPFAGGWPFDQAEREANERRDRRRAEAERRGHW